MEAPGIPSHKLCVVSSIFQFVFNCVITFVFRRNPGWEPHTCGDLTDAEFVRTLSPGNHFYGSRDAFESPLHNGGGSISAVGRTRAALKAVNANLRVVLEVRCCEREFYPLSGER